MIFEALNAGKGDCLLLRIPGRDPAGEVREMLWVVDGGPKSVLEAVLLPRLAQLRENGHDRQTVALGVVSHIDDDHINGLDKLVSQIAAGSRPDIRFEAFWFNAFEKLVGAAPGGTTQSPTGPALQMLGHDSLHDPSSETSETVMLQSYEQGDRLADNLRRSRIPWNQAFGGLVTSGQHGSSTIGAAKVTILGPRPSRVEALREKWTAAWKKADDRARRAALQALLASPDTSVPNLSSIVMLVEVGTSKLLLTGDALGDDIVDCWENDLDLGTGPVPITLLKLPHHGSAANSSRRFLAKFPALHYVFSADGTHGHPDPDTIDAVIAACAGREATLHFTNRNFTWQVAHRAGASRKPVNNLCELAEIVAQEHPNVRFAFPDPAVKPSRIAIELS